MDGIPTSIPPERRIAVGRSIVRRIVTQASILTTFVIVALSTVAFILAESALSDVVRTTGLDRVAAERALQPGLAMLTNSLTLVGALLVAFTAATAFLLARQVTNPLRELVAKVGALKPGEAAPQTVRTDDEVEALDRALVDMAGRLAEVYEHQEDEIAARTEDLRRQYELDRVILDSIHLGVITVDPEGAVALGNPAARTLLREIELEGRPIAEVLPLRGHGGAPLPGEHVVLKCLKDGGVFRTSPSTHWSIERTDGGLLPITLSVVPLKDGERSFGALVMFQNVSEERHIDYLKSEFITLASHQLRTPLSAIRWYAELLHDARDGLKEEERGYVDEIDRSVRRMITLLGALLHAARIEDETVRPALAESDLRGLVEEAVRDAEVIFGESGVKPEVVVPSDGVVVRTDPVLLKVVLQNLLSNAVKYSPKQSTVTIRLRAAGDAAAIDVEDRGMGIPRADQERIFEKFFRARNVRQIDTDGNGLGLYISKSIVERLGGSLAFKSAEGKGTTFTVELPVGKSA